MPASRNLPKDVALAVTPFVRPPMLVVRVRCWSSIWPNRISSFPNTRLDKSRPSGFEDGLELESLKSAILDLDADLDFLVE